MSDLPAVIESGLVGGSAHALFALAGVAWFFKKTPFGIAMRATADDPGAARIININAGRIGATAWFVGCGMATIAVAVSLNSSVTMIVRTVVCSIGSSLGALLGAGFFSAVPELPRDARAVSDLVYGGAMIAVLLWLGLGLCQRFAATSAGSRVATSPRTATPARLWTLPR